MAKYRITRRAENDLRNIGRYTQRQWGKAKRNLYLENLENRFNRLAERPSHGMHRTDLAEGYYSFPEGQHVVFYLYRWQSTVVALCARNFHGESGYDRCTG